MRVDKQSNQYQKRLRARRKFNRLAEQVEQAYGMSKNAVSQELGMNVSTYCKWPRRAVTPHPESETYLQAVAGLEALLAGGVAQQATEQKSDQLNKEEREAGQAMILEAEREEQRGRFRNLLWYAGGMITGIAAFGAATAAGMV